MVVSSEKSNVSEGEQMKELAAYAGEPELASSIQAGNEFVEQTEPPNPYELDAEEYRREEAKYAATQEGRNRRLFSTRSLLKRNWEPQSFLIGPRLLPKHGRMLITGTTGTGKSTLTLNLAASLATGSPMFGIKNLHKGAEYQQPTFLISGRSTVLYIDYEVPHNIRTLSRLAPLVEHFPDCAKDNLFFAPHPSRYRLQNEIGEQSGKGSYDALRQLVADVRPDVLILDPLSSTHSLQENGNEIKQAYNKADKLIDEYGCAVIVVHHASPKVPRNRNGERVERKPIEEIRGHSSQGDWADCHLHLSALREEEEREDPDEKLIEISFGKHRHCRKPQKRTLVVNFRTMGVRLAQV